MSGGDAEFLDRAKQSLDQRLGQTSAHVASRLSAARNQAVDSRRRPRPVWLPAMATAALVAVVVGIGLFEHTPEPVPVNVAGLEQSATDFELLTAGDELELYAEMDFYLWLEQRGVDAG